MSFSGDKHADASRFSLLYHFENLKLITRILDIPGMQLLGVTSICFELSELRLLLVSLGVNPSLPRLYTEFTHLKIHNQWHIMYLAIAHTVAEFLGERINYSR